MTTQDDLHLLEPADRVEVERLNLLARALKVLQTATVWPKHALIRLYRASSIYQMTDAQLVDMVERHRLGMFWTDPRLSDLPKTWNNGRR